MIAATAMTASSTVRAAQDADAQAICSLHLSAVRALCAPHYAPEVIEGWLRGRVPEGYLLGIRSGSMFVAEANAKVVGFGQSKPAEVLAVFVEPGSAGRGIGSLLLERALSDAGASNGVVRVESTINAVGFYEHHGFRVVGRGSQRRNDVDVPVVIMERNAG
jgi:ribosomal protein S18 acetylase RimI-like enzyme